MILNAHMLVAPNPPKKVNFGTLDDIEKSNDPLFDAAYEQWSFRVKLDI